jgi:hypothetical protein
MRPKSPSTCRTPSSWNSAVSAMSRSEAMPHAVVVGEVALEAEGALEDVRRGRNDLVVVVKILALRVIFARRTG